MVTFLFVAALAILGFLWFAARVVISAQIPAASHRELAADAQVDQRRAQMDQAELNLAYTLIRSPVTGIIGKKSVEVGQNVSIGQELLTVVPLGDIWVTANFKETQLAHMRPGQPVEIKVDAYGRA
jgi:membrane fusion protein, multidrug efflux system